MSSRRRFLEDRAREAHIGQGDSEGHVSGHYSAKRDSEPLALGICSISCRPFVATASALICHLCLQSDVPRDLQSFSQIHPIGV
jgi:hypothetical protein